MSEEKSDRMPGACAGDSEMGGLTTPPHHLMPQSRHENNQCHQEQLPSNASGAFALQNNIAAAVNAQGCHAVGSNGTLLVCPAGSSTSDLNGCCKSSKSGISALKSGIITACSKAKDVEDLHILPAGGQAAQNPIGAKTHADARNCGSHEPSTLKRMDSCREEGQAPAKLDAANLNRIRSILQTVRVQQNAASTAGITKGVGAQAFEPTSEGAMSTTPAHKKTVSDHTHLEDVLRQLQCICALVPVNEILKEHPRSLGMLVKSLQTSQVSAVAESAKCIYQAWLPKVKAVNPQKASSQRPMTQIPHSPQLVASHPPVTSSPTSSATATHDHMSGGTRLGESTGRVMGSAGRGHGCGMRGSPASESKLRREKEREADGNIEGEKFEALSADGAWYDAKVLSLLEVCSADESLAVEYRARVQYQNCNQVISEELPFQHIRRRSEAFSGGQVPQVGTIVLAFQQRKSYDLYYDADVLEIRPAGEPQVLVQYLHGPEERTQEWLPLQSLHRIREQTISFNQLRAVLPCDTRNRQEDATDHAHMSASKSLTPRDSNNTDLSGASQKRGPPYTCRVCGKAFNHPPAHSSHERTHLQQIKRTDPMRFHLLTTNTAGAVKNLAVVTPSNVSKQQVVEDSDTKVEALPVMSPGHASKQQDSAETSIQEVGGGLPNEQIDMKKILMTWNKAEESHVNLFKQKLREKHPEVSKNFKMCSVTQLLVDGSGEIRNKVVVNDQGEPTLLECSEKERALTISILRRKPEARTIAKAELDRASKEYTRFHLPLTLEAVRDLGDELRADERSAENQRYKYVFSTGSGRSWPQTLDPLLDTSGLPSNRMQTPGSERGVLTHSSESAQTQARHLQHFRLTHRSSRLNKADAEARSNVKRIQIRARALMADDGDLDGVRVYVNGTGAQANVQKTGVLVRGANDRSIRVKVGDRVVSLSEFCQLAGNTFRRVQESVMVAGTKPPLCLAQWIAKTGSCTKCDGAASLEGSAGIPKIPPLPTERRVRGRRVPLGSSEGTDQNGFRTSGSQYVGMRIALAPVCAEEGRELAEGNGNLRESGVDDIIMVLEDAESLVLEMWNDEYNSQNSIAAASVVTSVQASGVLVRQHLMKVREQALIKIRTVFNADAGKCGEITRSEIHGLLQTVSEGLAPDYKWLTHSGKATAISEAPTPAPAMVSANVAGDVHTHGAAVKVAETQSHSKMIAAVISHWMPANKDLYVSATWGQAASLWQCTRDDMVIEHLEEDEVRAALKAAGVRAADMPPIEDSNHGSWKRGRAIERAKQAVRAMGSSSVNFKAKDLDGVDSDKLYIKHKHMRPAAILGVQIINRLKATAFAQNGMLRTQQGRLKWKKMVCERDLPKFDKSIKSLEASLVWGAVIQDFDGMRKQLLESVEDMRTVDDAVKALQLLDSCILDSYRHGMSTLGSNGDENEHEQTSQPSKVVGTVQRTWSNGKLVRGMRNQSRVSVKAVHGVKARAGLKGTDKLMGKRVRLRKMLDVESTASRKNGARKRCTIHVRGPVLVGKEIKLRSRNEVSGKFQWLPAKVVGFEIRDKLPMHCVELLGDTANRQGPLWIQLKPGFFALPQSADKHVPDAVSTAVDERDDEDQVGAELWDTKRDADDTCASIIQDPRGTVHKARPVIQLNIETGEEACRFASLTKAAERAGIAKSTMLKTIKEGRECKGFRWVYADTVQGSPTTEKSIMPNTAVGRGYGPCDRKGKRVMKLEDHGMRRASNGVPGKNIRVQPGDEKEAGSKRKEGGRGNGTERMRESSSSAQVLFAKRVLRELKSNKKASSMRHSIIANLSSTSSRCSVENGGKTTNEKLLPSSKKRKGVLMHKSEEIGASKEQECHEAAGSPNKKMCGMVGGMNVASMGRTFVTGKKVQAFSENLTCVRCKLADRNEMMLVCDRCKCGWHTDCLPYLLDSVPEGAWKCPMCEDGIGSGEPDGFAGMRGLNGATSIRIKGLKGIKAGENAGEGKMSSASASELVNGSDRGKKEGTALKSKLERTQVNGEDSKSYRDGRDVGKDDKFAGMKRDWELMEAKQGDKHASGNKELTIGINCNLQQPKGVVKRGRGRPRKVRPLPADSEAESGGKKLKDEAEDTEDDTKCEGCKSRKRAHIMLLCDGCGSGWHIDCLAAPLKEVPRGHWFCDQCRSARRSSRL